MAMLRESFCPAMGVFYLKQWQWSILVPLVNYKTDRLNVYLVQQENKNGNIKNSPKK